ncbi:MAG TPA: hypothetical protein VGO56_12900 [Pyrinomonadaceae bacterium]|jgi:hypothetical protein|nr:hypothetical protein [Pyrinomonadaceae bacterium]
MKKQFQMVVTIIALLIIAGVSSANAQTQPRVQLNVTIPFAFTIGDRVMPAGDYAVRCTNPSSDVKVLQLTSANGHESALLRTNSVIGRSEDNAKLVFNRYGEQYFLAQVWLASDADGMQAIRSRTEKRMARELAANKMSKDTVAVTAKR